MSPSNVNQGLTRKRPKRVVENDDFVRFVVRAIRAAGQRVARGDVVALRLLAELRVALEAATDEGVAGLREHGFTWEEIGEGLETSRQYAQKRYGAKPPGGGTG